VEYQKRKKIRRDIPFLVRRLSPRGSNTNLAQGGNRDSQKQVEEIWEKRGPPTSSSEATTHVKEWGGRKSKSAQRRPRNSWKSDGLLNNRRKKTSKLITAKKNQKKGRARDSLTTCREKLKKRHQ